MGYKQIAYEYLQGYHKYYEKGFIHSKKYQRMNDDQKEEVRRSNFVRSHFVDYLTRDDACDKTSICGSDLDPMIKDNCSERSMLLYMEYRKGSEGLFGKDGNLTPKQVRELNKILRNTKGTIYDAVFTMSEHFEKDYVPDKQEMYDLLQDVIPKYLKNAGLDPDKTYWVGAYHTNTANRHAHILFFQDQREYSKTYQPSNVFNVDKLNRFKELVANHYYLKNVKLAYDRDDIVEEFEEVMKIRKEMPYIDELRQRFAEKEKQNRQYARLNNDEKRKINEIRIYLQKHTPLLDKYYKDYVKRVRKEHQSRLDQVKFDNATLSPEIQNWQDRVINDLNKRICNKILQNAYETPILDPRVHKDMTIDEYLIFKKRQKYKGSYNSSHKQRYSRMLRKELKLCERQSMYKDLSENAKTLPQHSRHLLHLYASQMDGYFYGKFIWRELERQEEEAKKKRKLEEEKQKFSADEYQESNGWEGYEL